MIDARIGSGAGAPGRRLGATLALALALLLASAARAQDAQPESSFDTPEAAAQALVAALGQAPDRPTWRSLFGGEGYDELVASADPVEWRQDGEALRQAAEESLVLRRDADDLVVLVVGRKAWPFPIPLAREDGAWRFDTAAGLEEILDRRIGAHELAAIELARAYVEAQVEYASEDRDGDEVLEYAQRILSSPGSRDGLYWPGDDDPSPLGRFVAEAAAPYEGGVEPGDPYQGFHFRVLTRQGPNPPGGAYDYVINGNMIAGFALLAFPASHGQSGIMSFLVSHQGRLVQKDLGPETAEIVRGIQAYDPDETWTEVTD